MSLPSFWCNRMPNIVSTTAYSKRIAKEKRTVPLDIQLSLRYVISTGVYVKVVVGEGDDVTDFELILVVVEKEMTQSIRSSAPVVRT